MTLPGGPADLHQGLRSQLPQPGNRAIVVINRTDATAGHVFNAENINGNIWIFEAHDGVAVPLHLQPKGVNGVGAFYPVNQIAPKGAYDVIVTTQ